MITAIFDRILMAFSLAVHIPLVVIGIALPLILLISEIMWYKTKDRDYQVLSKRMSRVLIVLFGVGTASGTVVALELLFLWPKFFALVGQVAILPVFAEVFAFFTEAIFLAAYIYFSDRIKDQRQRIFMVAMIVIGAALSGVFITMLNAFMNTPVGFNIPAYLSTGNVTGINPLAVFNSPSSTLEIIHVLATSYLTGAFIFLAYFAYKLTRTRDESEKRYYNKALRIAFAIAFVTILITIYTGSASLIQLYQQQPEKFAAIEGDIHSMSGAPEYIGGVLSNNTLVGYIAIPDLQSILVTGSANGTVPGLSSYNQSTWPPLFVHDIFDLLVFGGFGIGFFMILIAGLWSLKKKPFESKIILLLLIVAGAVAVLLLEGGWVMSEVGRQPWIIYNVMTVAQAANYSSAILPIAIAFAAFYALIIPFTLIMLKRMFDGKPLAKDLVNSNGNTVY